MLSAVQWKNSWLFDIDLSKAVDCLPHSLMIFKLSIWCISCKLIASYLYKVKQRVEIKDEHNEWLDISQGVPQGSILGPLISQLQSKAQKSL